MHEDRFWNALVKGANVWSILVVVIVVSLIVYVVLRFLTGAVADRRTRRMILDSMEDEGSGSPEQQEVESPPDRDNRSP